MTIEQLKAFGANTDEGVSRCVDNEEFYLMMVGKAMEDKNFDKLKEAIDAGDKKSAFEAAHALKGTLGNLSLDPILNPVKEITELLRANTDMDYTSLVDEIMKKKGELEAL